MPILSRKNLLFDSAAKLRRDLLTGQWSVLNPARSQRPSAFASSSSEQQKNQKQKQPPAAVAHDKSCVFCTGNEHQTPEAVLVLDRDANPIVSDKKSPDWQVRVINNKFPALVSLAQLAALNVTLSDADLHDINHAARAVELGDDDRLHAESLEMPALGEHWVVVEGQWHEPRNDAAGWRHSRGHVRRMLRAWSTMSQRFWRDDDTTRSTLFFKNCGKIAGCSQAHPHSQLLALPIVLDSAVSATQMHFDFFKNTTGGAATVFSHELDFVRKQNLVVCENELFVSYCPFASLSPYQCRIIQKNQKTLDNDKNNFNKNSKRLKAKAHFHEATSEEIDACADVLATSLKKLDVALGMPDFNLALTTPPLPRHEYQGYNFADTGFSQFYVDVIVRLGAGAQAGFEIGSGVSSCSVLPSEAAEVLRSANV